MTQYRQFQKKNKDLYHVFCVSQAVHHINRRNFVIAEKYVKQGLRSHIKSCFEHIYATSNQIYLNVTVFRICDQEMEYRLSILIGKCYLFSGKFDMSRVNNVIISLNL